MNIQTKFHGDIQINEEDLFTFENGLPGFVDETQFILLPLENTPFFVLQSAKTKEIAFIITNPFDVYPTYEVNLNEDVLTDLQISSEKEVAIYAILTIREPFNQTTANLQAPVILNLKNKKGKQYIMNYSNYSIRQPIIYSDSTEQEEI